MSYFKYVTIILYFSIAFYLFLNVYETSQLVIDEEFHLRQGLHYCNGNFTIWDPKITTFPGLYIVSAILFLPFKVCNVFTLRLTSLLASVVNVWFIYEIRKLVNGRQKVRDLKTSFETLTISLLPPMYFFAHVYYTDILSITTILGLLLFNMKHNHQIAAIFGFASVIMRQTNIVWVGFALGTTVIDKLVSQTMPFIKDASAKNTKTEIVYNFRDIYLVFAFYCRRIYLIPKQIKLLAFYLIGYIIVLMLFLVFLMVNGSIVIGDKSAHEASLHLPQIMYFALFSGIFGTSIVLATALETLKTLIRRWYIVVFAVVLMAIVIYFNTLVHPYLLADNRHYTFYVWNKFYGRYSWARYAIIPAYIYCMTAIYLSLRNKSAGFKMIYAICAFTAIALQKLIEVRYFIIPYLILRLNTIDLKSRYILAEFLSYCFVNFLAFNMFFYMEIYWSDYEAVQRIMW